MQILNKFSASKFFSFLGFCLANLKISAGQFEKKTLQTVLLYISFCLISTFSRMFTTSFRQLTKFQKLLRLAKYLEE